MRTVHLHDAQAEGVYGGPAAGISRAAPPHFAAGGSAVETESVRSNLDSRLASLAEAVPELARKTGKWKRQTQGGRRFRWYDRACN